MTHRDRSPHRSTTHPVDGPPSAIRDAFGAMSQELDHRHNMRERLITLSREITRNAKKVISALQRLGEDVNTPAAQRAINDADKQLGSVRRDIVSISAILPTADEQYQFLHNYSSSLEEYVEAESFLHYITSATGELVSLEKLNQQLRDVAAQASSEQQSAAPTHAIQIGAMDFVLGIYDLSGELMRRGTNLLAASSSSSHAVIQIEKIATFLRHLQAELAGLKVGVRGSNSKLEAMTQSIVKMENLAYKLRLRSAEGFDDVRSQYLNSNDPSRSREDDAEPIEAS